MEQLVETLQYEFKQQIIENKNLFERENPLVILDKKITVAIGMRRTGKTTTLLQEAKKLLSNGVPESNLLFVNFEDDRLGEINQEKLRNLIDAFYSLYPENHNQTCYLFFDEIQNVQEWSLIIRRIFDTKKVKIFLTGSSSKMLSTEIATELRGRCFTTEIWPYSFSEYLAIHKNPGLLKQKSQAAIDNLKKHLKNYLQQGGFPETINLQPMHRIKVLQDYAEIVVIRDIIDRYKISNASLIRYMVRYVLSNTASSFSINKFYNDLKSQGYKVTKTHLYDYFKYIEDCFLAFRIELFDESIRKVQTNPYKIYAIDPGLSRAYSMTNLDNYGRYFENMVYIDLRRKGCDIYYYLTKNRHEVDFIARDLTGKLTLYQVVWDTKNKETLDRETRALEEAKSELNIEGKIITPENYADIFKD